MNSKGFIKGAICLLAAILVLTAGAGWAQTIQTSGKKIHVHEQMFDNEQILGNKVGMQEKNYGSPPFDNPNYYYAAVKTALSGVWYRQAGLSPNGQKIVAGKQYTDGSITRREVVLMDANGTNEIIISPGNSGEGDIYQYGNPFWSDDGSVIGYVESHYANPNKVVRYVVSSGSRSYIYEPVAPLDVCNSDFVGNSTTAIVFWDWIVADDAADLFTWDGTTRTNITHSTDSSEYEPVSNSDGTVILYWSGETAAEPVNTTHTLTYSGGVWTRDVGFTPITDSYWSYWSTRSDNYIGVVVMSTGDVHLYSSTGTFVLDLTGSGYSGGAGQWNFFGTGFEGPNGEMLMTSNAGRADPGRDIIFAAPRANLYVNAATGSDSYPGTEYAPFLTINKAITEASGSTVHVAAGTYVENIVINKALSLVGAGQDSVLVYTSSHNLGADSCAGPSFRGSQMVVVQAANVFIKGFTFDGDNPGIAGSPDARNGIICDYYTSNPNNLVVRDCTVKNVFFRGIYGTGMGHITGAKFIHNTVSNVLGCQAGNEAAIILINATGDADSNIVTNSFTGVFFHNCSDGNIRHNTFTNCALGAAVNGNCALVTISNNTMTGGGSWGAIQVVSQQAAVNIQNNTITDASWGPIVFGGSAGNVSNFQNNSIYGPAVKGDLTKKPALVAPAEKELRTDPREGFLAIHPPSGTKYGDVGIYLTTDLSPWGYADVNAAFSGNIVANYDYDVICNEPADQTKLMNVTFGGSPGTTNYLYGYGSYAWYMDNCNDDINAQYNYWATTTPEAVIYHKVDDVALGQVNFANYEVPKVSLIPSSQLDKCVDKDTLWIHLDEYVVDMEAYYCSLAYDNSKITSIQVIAAPGLPDHFLVPTITSTSIVIDLGITTGNFDGPGNIVGIVLTANAQTVPDSTGVLFKKSVMRDPNNQDIPHTTSDAYIRIDCTNPTVTVLSPPTGGYYNYLPTLSIRFFDNYNLDKGYYQIDGCGGPWTAFWAYNSNSNDTTISWTVPSVSQATHEIYFKVIDDASNKNGDPCTYYWQFTYDVTAPSPPTNLVARPGHNKVKLSWTNATSDFHHTVIMRTDWWSGGHGYPEYDDNNAEGLYPTDTICCDRIYSGTGTSLTDVSDISNTTRDVYHYKAFTVDYAGNVSTPSNSDRSTSYWLGDVTGGDTPPYVLGNYDGNVYYQDLTFFSTTFRKSQGETGYINEFDIGPTYSGSPKGIPMTDNTINFEDLSIFSINYDAVNPSMKIAPIFTEEEITGPLCLQLSVPATNYPQARGEFKVSVLLKNNPNLVKSIHFVVPYNASWLQFIRVDKSKLLQGTPLPVFFDGRAIDNNVDVSLALLGGEATIGGSGEIATITFRLLQAGNPSLAFSLVDLRDNQNHKLLTGEDVAQLQSGSVIPQTYGLSQNYPNAFNPETQIAYQLPMGGQVSLKIYNIKGELVRTLVDEYMEVGYHTVRWNGRNNDGNEVASGVYFYRLVTNDFTSTKKMIMLK